VNTDLNLSPEDGAYRSFATLIRELVAIYGREGIHCKDSLDSLRSIDTFGQWPGAVQEQIRKNLAIYNTEALDLQRNGNHVGRDRDRKLLWRIFSKMGWVPPPELFDELGESDVIEVYDRNLIQIYRNTRFLELCSYPLDCIFSSQFPELFVRDKSINDEVMTVTASILANQHKSVVRLSGHPHIVTESKSDESKAFLVVNGIAAPIFDTNKCVVGILYSLTAEETSQ